MRAASKRLRPAPARHIQPVYMRKPAVMPSSTGSTPILQCDPRQISIQTSPPPLHPFQSPSFTIPADLLSSLKIAADHLHAGRTVSFPTETVYGLGANSLNPSATRLIYTIKNRPSDNPLIMHVSSLDMLRTLLPESYQLSKLNLALIDAFWPGPLSILFPSPNPPPPPAPQTNAIRMPSHPLAAALIHTANMPLSAPSANSSGRPSPTLAQHVWNDLNGAEGLGCILDGGPCGVGVESTVVNALEWVQGGGGFVDILRPGGLGVEEIERVVRQVDGNDSTRILLHGRPWFSSSASSSSQQAASKAVCTASSSTPKADLPPSTPGMKYRHYSPKVPVYLFLPSNTFPRPPTPTPQTQTPETILKPISAALALSHPGKKIRLGLLHYESSPLLFAVLDLGPELQVDIVPVSLGEDSASAAQRLFSGMLSLEGRQLAPADGAVVDAEQAGVDAILIEGCSDKGLGLAVMERVGKAVGGGGKSGELGNGQGISTLGRFWVQV